MAELAGVDLGSDLLARRLVLAHTAKSVQIVRQRLIAEINQHRIVLPVKPRAECIEAAVFATQPRTTGALQGAVGEVAWRGKRVVVDGGRGSQG
jgi:hypothetical protein